MRDVTRRDFIKGAGCAAVGLAVGLPVLAEEAAPVAKSRVVLIRNSTVVDGQGKIDAGLVQRMLDEAVVALFGEKDVASCWQKIVRPSDVVGIKSNHWGNLPTPPEVEEALRRWVLKVGVDEANVAVDDRGVLKNDVFLRATALINTRPMRTHAWSGVGSLIKNYIMFAEHPPDYHDDACAPLATLWDLPQVKGKTRLNVLVMLTPQYHTVGPHHFDPAYLWPYHGLIVSTDPVSADAVGLKIIQAKRRLEFGEERPLQPSAHHIALADSEYHLGNASDSKIDLVRIGWEDGVLI
jgi:hypothetical protein